MDNLQDTIAKIMSDPEALSQVQSLGKMLGIGDNSPKQEAPPHKPQTENSMIPADIMSKMTKLIPLFQQMQKEDDTTRLLSALRPFLSDEKCQKLDAAKKILQFMKLVPMLKESGIMDMGLF